jgi:uncharacterized protein (TIGR03437 family)
VSGFTGASYVITFYAAGRPQSGGCIDNCGELNFSVLVGGTDVLDVTNPPTGSFMQYTTKPFTATGTVTIAFTGTSTAGDDETSFITEVAIQDLSAAPEISSDGIVNGASFAPGLVVGSWATVQGSHLSSVTDTWDNYIVNGKLPTMVDDVSVSVGGQPAYVYFISEGQINFLVPEVPAGSQPVIVTNSAGASSPVTVAVSEFGPAFFTWPASQVVATTQSFAYVAASGTFPGTPTTAAKPGDTIILWGTGFGPTNPTGPQGMATPSTGTFATETLPTITIDNVPAMVYGSALAPGLAGLYQVAIQVPESLGNGNWPIVATIGGVSSPDNVMLTVQQ